MIIVKLIGGLGNQMFQYAFGRSLALKNNTNLKIDVLDLQNTEEKDFTLRNFELNVFNVQTEIASESEIQNFMKSKAMMGKDLLTLTLPFKSKNFYLREPHHHYFPLAKKATANTYAYGYFQSEKYFNDIRSTLLKDFTPRNPLSKLSQEVADRMSKVNGVSIHVRRGDYVSNKVNLDVHGLCEVDYYEKALAIIKEK
ncbi:MAG: alpha-1,2-fucosyltransferase [Bacteroidetes bacterium]|nr:alpha-1,2-fucosyltransferase [Bacteroidota bacterium]